MLSGECRHLFSYAQRGGELFVGVFDHAAERESAGDGLSASPAVVRIRKLRAQTAEQRGRARSVLDRSELHRRRSRG
jgi:hypothetical protein